jgi:hypothetical protein
MKGMQDNIFLENVVAKPIVPTANAPLPLPGIQSGELLDLVLPRCVLWILSKDRQKIFQNRDQLLAPPDHFLGLAFKRRGCEDTEGIGHDRRLFLLAGDRASKLGQKNAGLARSPATIVFLAFPDLFSYARISQFEIVLEFIRIHNPGHGDAVFFQDEVFPVQMGPTNHLSQIDPGLRDWNSLDQMILGSCQGFSQLINND